MPCSKSKCKWRCIFLSIIGTIFLLGIIMVILSNQYPAPTTMEPQRFSLARQDDMNDRITLFHVDLVLNVDPDDMVQSYRIKVADVLTIKSSGSEWRRVVQGSV